MRISHACAHTHAGNAEVPAIRHPSSPCDSGSGGHYARVAVMGDGGGNTWVTPVGIIVDAVTWLGRGDVCDG